MINLSPHGITLPLPLYQLKSPHLSSVKLARMKNNLNALCGKNTDKKKFSQAVWMTESVQMISLEDNITKGPF